MPATTPATTARTTDMATARMTSTATVVSAAFSLPMTTLQPTSRTHTATRPELRATRPSRTFPLALAIPLLTAGILACAAGSATAQPPRFGAQLDLGAVAPLGPAARSSIRLRDPRTEDDLSVGSPELSDVYRTLALRPGLTVQLGNAELRYAFERGNWSHARVRCTSTDTAIERGNGAIDDRGIRWECLDTPERGRANDAWPAYSAHHISGGARFYAPEILSTYPWGGGGAGLTFTRFDRDAQRSRLRAGTHAHVGGGIDLPIDRNLTLGFDLRYQVTLLAATARFADNARRASTTGRGVAGAVLDVQQGIILGLGFRANLR